jgi:sugar phosphate isomerase/epimerase
MTVPNFIPAQFRYPFVLCSTNERVRSEAVQHVTRTIDTALKFKARTVSCCPGTYIDDKDLAKGWKVLKQSITEILEHSANKPIKLLLEPAHRWESNLIRTVEDCVKMIKEIGSNDLGICLDVGHINVNGEDIYKAVMAASAYPLHIHIDDNHGEMDTHNLPGQGTVDFDKLKRALRDCHYQGCLSVELGFHYTLDPENATRESLDFLKKTFR